MAEMLVGALIFMIGDLVGAGLHSTGKKES